MTSFAARNRRPFRPGPGLDDEQFVAGGLRYIGIDLAFGNAHLAAERGLTVLQADLSAVPIRSAAFDGGWSMSTLMHVPTDHVKTVVRQMAEVLRPGAPLLVGLWGGRQRDIVSEQGVHGQRRLFSMHTFERNLELLAHGGEVEWTTTWVSGDGDWQYQVFRLRSTRR